MALIEIAATTTMEEVLQAYPSAKVGLFQSYHIGGCESCGYQPTQSLEEVRRDFNIQDGVDKMASVIRASDSPRSDCQGKAGSMPAVPCLVALRASAWLCSRCWPARRRSNRHGVANSAGLSPQGP